MGANILEKQYIQNYQVAYIYTFSLCKNKELAEDIVSQSFEKAFVSYTNEKTEFKYWLLTVCRNQWIDNLRKNKWISQTPLDENRFIFQEQGILDSMIQTEKQKIIYENMMKHPNSIKKYWFYITTPIYQLFRLLNC